jgi:hypothetical protein
LDVKEKKQHKNLYKEVLHRVLFFLKGFLKDEIKKEQMVEAFCTLWRYVKEMLNFKKNVMGNYLLRDCSNTGIVGSNPTHGMDVCVRLLYVCVVLCTGSGLATG